MRRRARAWTRSLALCACAMTRTCAADVATSDWARQSDAWTFQGAANATRRRVDDEAAVLRLTPAASRAAGSSFATVKQLVVGGFVAEFAFAVSAGDGGGGGGGRGGDGFAFAVQNADARALGGGGNQLGYGGIVNCVVVEFDTHHDAHARDPYNNHAAVLTRGAKAPALASHDFAVGTSVNVPNLADGERHVVRIVYDPEFVVEDAAHASFRSGEHLLDLMRDYAHGLGTLKVFVDDLGSPALTVPMNLGAFLDLDNGRAWVGFTASTGESFQAHDVLSFRFRERLGGGLEPAA